MFFMKGFSNNLGASIDKIWNSQQGNKMVPFGQV